MFLSAIIEAGASRLSRFTMPGSSRAMSSVHLSNLCPAKGSTKDNVRRGRGQGSTKGGTAGRGHKGQLARSGNGKPHPGFEGGQSPITRRFPKRGFYNYTRRDYAPLSIATLQRWIASGRIDPAQPITIGTVVHSNAVHGLSHQAGIKLLGTPLPDLPFPPLNLQLSRYSKSSAAAVIEAGGEVTAVYHNALALRQELFPHKFPKPVKMADPIRRTDIEFYSNPENHGYLAKRAAAEAVEAEAKAKQMAKVKAKQEAKAKAKQAGTEAPQEAVAATA